ncbi:MAG TPA: M56 family metallopeptidase, partial [Verrucomicrobiae bacterium]|nr:M56 family metallopeptidase [Verrucomicrobiae bacterium]
MNAAWGWVDRSLAERLGWALVHSLWQGAALAVVYSLVRLGIRRYSANARYLAGCLMLVSLLAAPVLTALYGPWGFSLTSPARTDADGSLGSKVSATQHGRLEPVPLENGVWRCLRECGDFLDRSLPSVVTAWLVGVSIVSCRWLQGLWWVRRVRTVQVQEVEPALRAVLEYLKCRFEIRRPVRLVKSALAEVPMVVGWLRPVILLPGTALTGLTLEQLESILAHELAHVRRLDYLVNALQNLIETLMFYHPAVWWVSRCVREEREHCCDDLVVRVCEDRVLYARALFRLEELRGTPSRLVFAASGGSLLQRIRRLVGGGPETWPVSVREFSGLTLLAVGCVLVLAGACLLVGTRTYSGTARIRLEPQRPAAMPMPTRESGGFYDPYYIQTDFEVIQSQVILGRVIDRLDLNKEWGEAYGHRLRPGEPMELLKQKLELRPVRNTSIIEIKVYDPEPAQAAKIANTIARVYADYRTGRYSHAAQQGVDTLLARLNEQDALVARAQSNVNFLRQGLKVHEGISEENS